MTLGENANMTPVRLRLLATCLLAALCAAPALCDGGPAAAQPAQGEWISLFDGKTLNGNEAVVQWLRDNNTKKDVYINTFLYREKDLTAVKVMQVVAAENGGRYKFISPDE